MLKFRHIIAVRTAGVQVTIGIYGKKVNGGIEAWCRVEVTISSNYVLVINNENSIARIGIQIGLAVQVIKISALCNGELTETEQK